MLRRLVGPETYARALDLYFERHDGQACTIEDWLAVFEDASGRDLAPVQALVLPGRHARGSGPPSAGTAPATRLDLAQETPPTPGQPEKAPLVIPVAYGLLDARRRPHGRGRPRADRRQRSPSAGSSPPARSRRCCAASRRRSSSSARPRPPSARSCSPTTATPSTSGRPAAPTRCRSSPASRPTRDAEIDPDYLAALAAVADDAALDPAFRALVARPALRGRGHRPHRRRRQPPDPLAIWRARRRLEAAVAARAGRPARRALSPSNAVPGPYSPDAGAAGRRALRARALAYLTALDPEAARGAARSSPPPTT